ncbi:MAG: hypothetical protein KC492_42220, partial [Myxococcales bacterium]|nr:hypothetical protein [Myxococcales bacterium]
AGQKKYDAGDYAGALEAWQAADDIMHVPTTGIRLGKAQEKLGKLVEARDAWLEVARHPSEPNEPKAFTAARQEAAALAAAVEKRIPSITVTVSGVSPDVELEVSVDDVSVPPAAATLPRKVNPGAHHLRVGAVGYLVQEQDFSLEEAETRTLNVELARDPAAVTAPVAPPVEPAAPPPTPAPGPVAPPPLSDPQADGGGGSNTLAIVGFTLAGVGVVVGGVTGIMSATKTSDIKNDCEGNRCPTDSQSDIDSAKTLATVSNIGFGVGILGLGVGVLGLVLDDSGSAQRGPTQAKRGFSLTPVLGLGSFNVLGSF